MDDAELSRQVRALRAEGRSPKQIARALGVRLAVVAPMVRSIAAENAAEAPPPPVVGCWISPGWDRGLIIEKQTGWPVTAAGDGEFGGLATVVVARRHRWDKISACTYLVDVYCLGVKNTIGPRVVSDHDLGEFVRDCFSGYDSTGLPAPVELAQHLVLGAVEYARQLGFEPHPDFAPARGHLGDPAAANPIRFGHNGKPMFIQGPYDDARRITRTLDRTIGNGNYHFTVDAGTVL
jgi:hypothetical protein